MWGLGAYIFTENVIERFKLDKYLNLLHMKADISNFKYLKVSSYISKIVTKCISVHWWGPNSVIKEHTKNCIQFPSL